MILNKKNLGINITYRYEFKFVNSLWKCVKSKKDQKKKIKRIFEI